jgi:hypothetical protein
LSKAISKRNDTLSEIYAEPKESFLHRYGKRIAGGLACAAVVSFIMHLPYIKLLILWFCHIFIFIFGRPHGAEKLPELEKKAGQAIAKVKQIASTHKEAIPAVAAPLAVGVAAPKLKQEIRVFKETADRIKAVEKKAQNIADAGNNIAKAARETGTKVKEGVDGVGARVAKALHDRKEAKEKAHHDQLIVRARTVGVKADESWSLARLDAEVNQAEDKAWRKRYNAQCPRCHRPTRIYEGGKNSQLQCVICKTIFSGRTARALGAPVRPRPRY